MITALRRCIQGLSGEAAERNAIQRCFDMHGHRRVPEQADMRMPDGRKARVYLWRDTPAGHVALVSGPDVEALVVALVPHRVGEPLGDLYIPKKGSQPALTGSTSSRMLSPMRSNPRGRATAGTGSSFEQLRKAVVAAASEAAQLNLVVRVLAGAGYADAADPGIYSTTVDRSTLRFYVWKNTPFGDHVILATGPSFEPSLALAADVPNEISPGIYVQAMVAETKPRAMAGTGRAATRGARGTEPRERVRPPAPEPRRRAAPAGMEHRVGLPGRAVHRGQHGERADLYETPAQEHSRHETGRREAAGRHEATERKELADMLKALLG